MGEPLQGSPAERLDQIVRWMDELNIQTLVNLTGGTGEQLQHTITEVVNKHPGRLITCTVPSYDKLRELITRRASRFPPLATSTRSGWLGPRA